MPEHDFFWMVEGTIRFEALAACDTQDETKAMLEVQKKDLEDQIEMMQESYSGCDWCCGGGDEDMAQLKRDLALVNATLAAIAENPGEV